MKISVITPSFNQAQFLPANLSSVVAQTYGNLEHIVIDPGSSDGSREIAAAARHAILIAEPDRGQSDGICKGFARSKGDILTWLNSDDLYPSNDVLETVAREFEANPDIDVVYGNVNFVDEKGNFLRRGYVNSNASGLLESFQYQVGIVQPGLFMRRSVFEKVGGPSEQYEYCMDYEYWVRIASAGFKWKHIDQVLAHHRWWDGMKTSKGRDASLVEHMRVCNDYFGYIHWKWLDRYAEYLTSNKDGVVNHSSQTDPEAKARNIKSVIERFVSQTIIHHLETHSDAPRRETLDFIQKHAPKLLKYYTPAAELPNLSEHHPDPQAHMRTAWHIFDAVDGVGHKYKTYKVPENFHRAFDASWFESTLREGKQKLKALAANKKSNICVVVANGPSLNKTDFSLFHGVDVIISNFATLNETLLSSATIVTVTNTLVAEQGSVSFNNIRVPKILPIWLSHGLNHTEETCFVGATVRPEFGTSLESDFSWRSTVSYFNMQLAYALGFEKVILVGFDHNYMQPADVKEGDRIEQKEDDNNHFDPRYFKNKVWQAADTGNMEQVYKLAKAAFEADGREIVNCTVGGHLEVFRRGDLATELLDKKSFERPKANRAPLARLPRTLVFDITPLGNGTATGEVKKNLFASWTSQNYLQVHDAGNGSLGIVSPNCEPVIAASNDLSKIKAAIAAFKPELILYRPVPNAPVLHSFAMQTLDENTDVPLVTWIMDDWVSSLKKDDPQQWARLEPDWRALISKAHLRLSISRKMSEVMEARYGLPFEPFANGVDPSEWPERQPATQDCFTIRYAGALAENMTAQSVLRVAQAVEKIAAGGHKVKLEIRTRPLWRDSQVAYYSNLEHTAFHTDLLSQAAYREWLGQANAVLIGYNFDSESLNYIGASMANKMPECLASGAPVIAHGPTEAATIEYLKQRECALVIDTPDLDAVAQALKNLIDQKQDASNLAGRARAVAFEHHNLSKLRPEFEAALTSAAFSPTNRASCSNTKEGSMRDRHAYVDETAVVAYMLNSRRGAKHVMLDVGAHFGTSAAYFNDLDWSIHCFEPDPNNRAKLMERFGKAPNVRIDPRAVSDKPAKGLQFYTSGESTGISGLHAFRETHTVTATVDATTVADIVRDKNIDRVDFLKIDVEGFDLNVLKGVPWDTLRPDVIECEFEDAKTLRLGHDWKFIANYLEEKGYTVYVSEWHPIVRYGIPHDWRRVVPFQGCELGEDAWGNFLAFREDPGYDAVRSAFSALVKTRVQGNSEAGSAANSPASPANISMSGLGKAATSAQSIKTTNDQNGIVNMLQKTPPDVLGAHPPQGKMWYSGPAHKLQQISPPAFGALRFARRTFAHVMSRPHMVALLLGSSALTAWVGLDARFDENRDAIFTTAGLGLLGAALVYVAAKAQAHLATLHLQNAAVRAELAHVQARLSQVDQQISIRDDAATAALTRQVAELKADFALAKASSSQSAAELKAKYAELSNKSAALLADASKIKADLAPLAQKLTELEKADQALLAKTREGDQALSSRIDALKNERADIEGQVASVSQKVGAMDVRITASEKWSRFENAAWFQHFNRKLSRQHIDTLDKEWRKRLSIPMQPATLGYMANRACEIERQLEGRLATSIEDILLRSLVARAVRGKNVDVLEIGTLFGTGAAIMFDALEGHYEQIHFTLLDPLEGYYNSAQADILTGQRVNESVVRKNFARVGMREDQYTLIKHLSTEPEAKEKASARKYDVLVIDGDHSYAGVKTDFENFAPLVRVGGYIILDDYNSPDWPDVKEYVDKELGKHDFVAPVGATWRTSVYRVVKDAPGLDHSASASARTKLPLNPATEDTQSTDD